MDSFLSLIARHGYSIIFLSVFAESVGLPLPAALAMVAGGAAAASGILSAPAVFAICFGGMVVGDLLVYFFGRRMGWFLLAFLCKVSVNPETCILRSAESFYKRGKTTLVIAKFIPGIATMAAPLAGSMKMRLGQFLLYDAAGATLYTLVYAGLGYLFHNFLGVMVHGFQTAGRAVEIVVVLAVAAYIAYRAWLYWTHRVYRVVPRIPVELLVEKVRSDDSGKIVLADVRSHGYYDSGSERILGSIRLEPNNLAEAIASLPKDREIYLYCT
ncbi:MAG: VTT domain-containing protein [Acidobacteriia bacterium]|nr:VTT domain-containing protein [Terriglobia bacterium]